VANDGTGITIDDGTATGVLRLAGDAAALLPLLEPGDAIAATGWVLAGPEVRLEVRSAGDITRLGDLGEALPIEVAAADPADPGSASAGPPTASPDGSADVGPVDGLAASAAASGGSPAGAGDGPATAGFGLSLVVGAGWAAFVSARRRRQRRRLAAQVQRRLAALP
jgi:hypothetical protein